MEPRPDQRVNPDKTGYRMGVAPSEDIANKMKHICEEAKKYISKERTERRKTVTIAEMKEHLNNMRGMVMIAYPAYYGLPEWDYTYLLLEDKCDYLAVWPDCGYIDGPQTAWFCNKELDEDRTLGENMTGRPNEKSTIVVKLTPKGDSAPVRESPIDQETHKQMLAFYHRKQEEQKKLEENEEDQYLDSPWADPNALKRQLHGQGNINWR